MIEIEVYSSEKKNDWNNLVERSRVDTFLFNRDFMDYHSDRFKDLSFMIYRNGKLEALLPGNIDGDIYYSHQGLTYGGFISTTKLIAVEIMESFVLINKYLKELGVNEVIYKPSPSIYHLVPSQEDIYSLFKLGARRIGCNLSSYIFQNNKIKFTESRKGGIRKAKREAVIIRETNDLLGFWSILNDNLMKNHGKLPVHSVDEISALKEKFPSNIRLFCAELNNDIIAGCLLFVMQTVVHVQYISANSIGKTLGANDLLFDELINNLFTNIPIFDFGQSTENLGNYLNESLIFQKEGFGGRGVVYEVYNYTL